MAFREDTHMDPTTHDIPAHARADVRATLKARLADSIDLMLHVTPAHGHITEPRSLTTKTDQRGAQCGTAAAPGR